MNTTNCLGIFARTINGNVNTGINAVRGMDDAKCRRIYRACAEILGAEETAFVRADQTMIAGGMTESSIAQTVSLTRCTVGQAWASAMLSAVQSSLTAYHPANGGAISDTRPADKTLRQCMAA